MIQPHQHHNWKEGAYVKQFVTSKISNLRCKIGKFNQNFNQNCTQPRAAYTAFTRGLNSKWNCT